MNMPGELLTGEGGPRVGIHPAVIAHARDVACNDQPRHTDLNLTPLNPAFSSRMAYVVAPFALGLALGPSRGVFRPISWTVKTAAPIVSITTPA